MFSFPSAPRTQSCGGVGVDTQGRGNAPDSFCSFLHILQIFSIVLSEGVFIFVQFILILCSFCAVQVSPCVHIPPPPFRRTSTHAHHTTHHIPTHRMSHITNTHHTPHKGISLRQRRACSGPLRPPAVPCHARRARAGGRASPGRAGGAGGRRGGGRAAVRPRRRCAPVLLNIGEQDLGGTAPGTHLYK